MTCALLTMGSQALCQSPSKKQQSAPASAQSRADCVGSEKCAECHKEVAASYFRTAHYLTSQPASKDSIAGKFDAAHNTLPTANPALVYRMEANKDGFFQAAVEGTPPDASITRQRFDIVVGSGRKGQSYIYWKDDQLFQLPVSYWTQLDSWVNSPGYLDGVADFHRPILPRCLECHGTYFEAGGSFSNHYKKSGYTLGISCEKCHGPGREHVARYSSKNAPGNDGAVVNPAKLDRARQMDGCALCHGGIGNALAPAFTYKPGEPVTRYVHLTEPGPNDYVDVHGNQVALLERSRCFQESQSMTCTTCHNVHAVQREAAAFSKYCLACHKPESCGLFPKLGNAITKDCVSCHMPLQQSNAIVSSFNGAKVQPMVRSHWIKAYPQAEAARSQNQP